MIVGKKGYYSKPQTDLSEEFLTAIANADVYFVVVSIQNMLSGIELNLGGVTLPAGELFGVAIDLANNYTAKLSPYSRKYYYADIRQNGHVEFFEEVLRDSNGNVEYYKCKYCGRLYYDVAGKKPVADKKDVVIPKLSISIS